MHKRTTSNNNSTTKLTHALMGFSNREISSFTIDSNAICGVLRQARMPLILRMARSIFSRISSLSQDNSNSWFGKLQKIEKFDIKVVQILRKMSSCIYKNKKILNLVKKISLIFVPSESRSVSIDSAPRSPISFLKLSFN